MTKRFLDEEDLSEIQRGISDAQNVANNASETVKQVSEVAQNAAKSAEEAAENASSAYSPQNKPTPAEIGALPLNGSKKMTGDLQISTSNEAVTALIEYMGYTYLRNARGDGKKLAEIVFNTEEAPMYGVVEYINGQPSIKQYMLYGEHNPPTPEELGAVLSTLPEIEDANASIAESNSTGIKFERWSKTTLNTPYTQGLTTRSDGVVITAVIKGTFATQLAFPIGGRGLYIRHNIVGSVYAWTEYGDFKSDGSVPMTGTVLNMSNGEGCIENNGIEASIRVRKVANDDSNSTSLVLDNSFYNSPHRKILLRDTVDGEDTEYRLYGEHNVVALYNANITFTNCVGYFEHKDIEAGMPVFLQWRAGAYNTANTATLCCHPENGKLTIIAKGDSTLENKTIDLPVNILIFKV